MYCVYFFVPEKGVVTIQVIYASRIYIIYASRSIFVYMFVYLGHEHTTTIHNSCAE